MARRSSSVDSPVVDDRRHPAHVADLGLGPVQGGDLVDGRVHDVGGLPPGVQVQAAHGPGQLRVLRDHVRGVARLDPAPGEGKAGAGVDPAGDQRGDVDGDPGGGGDQVGGQVRAGGVPAGAVERDLQAVAGAGDRPVPQPDPPGLHPGVAVHGEDPADPGQRPRPRWRPGRRRAAPPRRAGRAAAPGGAAGPWRAGRRGRARCRGRRWCARRDRRRAPGPARSTGTRSRSWCRGWAGRRCRRAARAAVRVGAHPPRARCHTRVRSRC